jgi:hypothetical protein
MERVVRALHGSGTGTVRKSDDWKPEWRGRGAVPAHRPHGALWQPVAAMACHSRRFTTGNAGKTGIGGRMDPKTGCKRRAREFLHKRQSPARGSRRAGLESMWTRARVMP